MTPFYLSASLLAADFANLGAEVQAVTAAGVDMIHLDVMDGVFVPALTFGPPVVRALRPLTPLPFDAHLMTINPYPLITPFAEAGCNTITIHPETVSDVRHALNQIRAAGCRAGLAFNPDAPLDILSDVMGYIDLIVIMTVQAGAGGQTFRPLYDKIRSARSRITATGRDIDLSVDGGISADNARDVVAAGASILVSGTFIFQGGQTMYAQNIQAIKEAVHAA